MSWTDKIFKKKTQSEEISEKVESIVYDILTSEFSNEEISIIVNTISKECKSVLENRKINLEKELEQTIRGINSIRV